MDSTIVTHEAQAIGNIVNFESELRASPGLQGILGTFKVWYVYVNSDGGLACAPSKFVSYQDNTADKHLKENGKHGSRHGNKARPNLSRWFVELDQQSAEYRRLLGEISRLYGLYGKHPQPLTIFKHKTDPSEPLVKIQTQAAIENWIVHNPDICGGKPTVKGTRMRVSDVLGLLAGGESVETILEDYPSLRRYHIEAALGYAAMAIDHPVIRAA
jgi:uncharacterized protein (DUF433 family)